MKRFSLAFCLLGCTEKSSVDPATSCMDDTTESTLNTETPDTDVPNPEADESCPFPTPSACVSVEEHESGLGPGDLVMGHWTLAFNAEGYS